MQIVPCLGLLPIIQHMKCDGREQENFEIFEGRKDHLEKTVIEVSINGEYFKTIHFEKIGNSSYFLEFKL